MQTFVRRWLPSIAFGLALAGGCTIDFDRFDFGGEGPDAAGGLGGVGGSGAIETGGAAGTGGSTGGSGGTGGDAGGGSGGIAGEAGPDVDADVADVDAGDACPTGQISCSGTCVAADDPAFGCGSPTCAPCNLAQATATCSNGSCAVLSCLGGFENCDLLANNGCEVLPSTDVAHCGGCNDACVVPNATPGCVAGTCTIVSCNQNFDDCDADTVTGCETNLLTDGSHCGSCDRACQVVGDVCNNGQCVSSTCQANLGDCDNNLANGCETNLRTDPAHCGACNDPCVLANATAGCSAGDCTVAACNAGFDDCDAVAATGCEEDLRDNANHCGACNRACSAANTVTQTCTARLCTSSCQAGFGNCSLPASGADDGCETNLQTSLQNCGACGVVCSNPNGSTECVAGTCMPQCSPGFADCNGNPLDGCETNVSIDVANCGACARACSAQNVLSRACSAGVCASTCALGFANCTQPAAPGADDGCERAVSADSTSCGGCGNSCNDQAGGLSCSANACGCTSDASCRGLGTGGICDNGRCRCGGNVCAAGEGCTRSGGGDRCSCNGQQMSCPADHTCCQTPAGCKDLATDAANCGACGHACPPSFACQNRVCVCAASSDCNAGSPGTCTAGQCVCGAATCGVGQRCLVGGVCG